MEADDTRYDTGRCATLCRPRSWELQELVVEEDRIAARLIGQGTHTGPFSGIAPTGRKVSTQELVIYRFADGKIVQCWGDLFPVVRDALMAAAHTES